MLCLLRSSCFISIPYPLSSPLLCSTPTLQPLSFVHNHSCPSIPRNARVMPAYFLQDCHYFYRTALRGLNVSTSVSPLYT